MSALSLALNGTKVDRNVRSSIAPVSPLPVRGLDTVESSRVIPVPNTTTDSLSLTDSAKGTPGSFGSLGGSPSFPLGASANHGTSSSLKSSSGSPHILATSPSSNSISHHQPLLSSSLRASRTNGDTDRTLSPLARAAGMNIPLSTSAGSPQGFQLNGGGSPVGSPRVRSHRRTSSSSRNRRLSSSSLTPSGSYIAKSSPLAMAAATGSSLKNSTAIDDMMMDGHPSTSSPNGPLNTNSPIAIAAAAAVTPDKLSRLLLSQGPLAIRHITSHLALTITGFADLSLSKQRRLIIAALDSGDPINNVVFEKVGWGRWTARKTDGHHIKSSKRRESITAHLNTGKPPMSPILRAADSQYLQSRGGAWADDVDLADDDMMFHNSARKPPSHDTAVFDDDDEDEEDYEEDDDYDLNSHGRLHRVMGVKLESNGHHRRRDSNTGRIHRGGDTDEEDWRGMGAASLRNTSCSGEDIRVEDMKIEGVMRAKELEAIDALVQLRSI